EVTELVGEAGVLLDGGRLYLRFSRSGLSEHPAGTWLVAWRVDGELVCERYEDELFRIVFRPEAPALTLVRDAEAL
ncbi:MAG: hypothetical protein LBQ79_00415, partial [Deltaproteobacteria bacterium]|nr:hypothetical protein [Deltaproteobacteria bacterium]